MHYCDDINGEKPINYKKWREEFLKCRQCKRSLVIFLGNYLLQSIQMSLQPLQVLYVAGCFKNEISNTAWFAKGTNKPQPDPNLYSNAEETDSRIWLHATKAEKRKILVQSPDTDVYHIGLPLTCISSKEVVIQLSSVNSQEVKIINLSKFALTLKNDPDMVGISCELVPKIMQTIYIATGCDYISFFNNLGKSTFLKYFFEYSSFITAGTNINTPGMLSDTEPHQQELGYYSFLRLVGVVYFKKHASGFSTSSPVTHFNSIHLAEADYKYNHIQWLNAIRMNIWDRVKFENEMIPGDEALLYHWKRTCWISNMWKQADCNVIHVDNMKGNGWIEDGDNIKIKWDSDINQENIKQRVATLLKGCSCKTGCKTRICGCVKKGEECNEGCSCNDCENMAYLNHPSDDVAAIEHEEIFGEEMAYEEMIYDSDESEIDDSDEL